MTSIRHLPAALIAVLVALQPALAAEPAADPDAFKAAPDWKVEVLAKAPGIQHPSVVTTSPDGRIFVGEDPVDMHLKSYDALDRILCIFPDGRKTVFAEKLHAVYGLEYIDGKVFVHHPPFVSVFTDDGSGVATKRVDLISCTNPNPWADGGFNDHIPANFRLGMDGFLYMSVGDKGIYGAVGTDGSKAELRGGGVLRFRPDGSQLEVYSSGTRNHLDVALNAEDELFTYDNTDDGLGWWTRYTHMVDGGFYGYPWDFRPDDATPENIAKQIETGTPGKPYTLWRMAEYGGGSPCGAVTYSEDALPAEFRENNFHCEWGKARVERFVVEREGATYKVVKRDDQFLAPGGQFRPVGICVTHDGTGFLVTDWNFAGWKNSEAGGKVGRLIRMTYTGKMNPKPRPAWYVAAGTGKPFEATTAELIDALKHPARSVRMVAQRRIVERGKEAIDALTALLKDKTIPAYARWHAIWTLDAIDKGQASRKEMMGIVQDRSEDVSVRQQVVRQLGTRKAAEAIDAIGTVLAVDEAPSLEFQACVALGRIGKADVVAISSLTTGLESKDLFVQQAAITAMTRIGRDDRSGWGIMLNLLVHQGEATKQGTLLAMREAYDERLIQLLAEIITETRIPPEPRVELLGVLAPLHRQPKPWDGKWWGTQPARSPRPAKVVEWAGTPIVAKTIVTALQDKDRDVRLAAIAASRVAPDAAAAEMLTKLFRNESDLQTRTDILHALAESKPEAAVEFVGEILNAPEKNVPLLPVAVSLAETMRKPALNAGLVKLASQADLGEAVVRAIESLGRLKEPTALPALTAQVKSKETKVAVAAINSLAQIGGGESTAAVVIPALADERIDVRRAAITALVELPSPAAFEPLLKAYADPATRQQAIVALSVTPDLRALDAYLEGLGSADGNIRDKARAAVSQLADPARSLIEQKLDKAAYSAQTIDELQRLYSFAPVVKWTVIGPFANPTDEPFDVANPPTSGTFKGAKGDAKWYQVTAGNRGHVDLADLFNSKGKLTAYVIGHVSSPMQREVELLTGSDDTMTLWLNGQQVLNDTGDSAWNPEEQRTKVTLKAGDNVLVAKIGNTSAGWEFSVALPGDRTGKIFEYDTSKLDPALYASFAMEHPGNIENGKKLFFAEAGVGCAKCHKADIGGPGGEVGPALNGVGAKYDRAKLIESVLYPSKQIFDGYHQVIIRTKAGKVVSGSIRGESESDVTLLDANGVQTVIRKADIDRRKVSDLSLMPEGLHATLKPEEFADLVAYMQSLKESPPPAK